MVSRDVDLLGDPSLSLVSFHDLRSICGHHSSAAWTYNFSVFLKYMCTNIL